MSSLLYIPCCALLATACLAKPSSQSGSRSDASLDSALPLDSVLPDAPRDSFCMQGTHVVYEDWLTAVDCDKGMSRTGGGANANSSNGQMVFATNGMGTYASCLYSPFPDTTTHVLAVIAHVDSVLVGTNDDTYLQVYAGTESVAIQAMADGSINDPHVQFLDHTGVPAGSSTMFSGPVWWRITFAGMTAMTGEYSIDDGTSWLPLGQSAITGGSASASIGMFSASGYGGTQASFDKLYYCR